MIDIHTHFGQFNNSSFNLDETLDELLKQGLTKVGIMPLICKSGKNIKESHYVLLKLNKKYQQSIIPILWIHPFTKTSDIEQMLEEFPYKIIKIHGYLHDWHKFRTKLLKIICLANKKKYQ